ncbi:MAG TPA: hypothetical protein VEA60_13165, partial [Allosphingosinicella sp.]|nr:hypothetical protein [Allosphingosinicella sp.]
GAVMRTVFSGGSFGDNLIAALPEIIGATIGQSAADALTSRRAVSAPGQTEETNQAGPTTGLREVSPGQWELPLSDGTILTGSLTEIEAGLSAHVAQLREQGLTPSWVEPTGGSSAPEGGFFQEGSAILRYQEGGTGLLWQDIHRNVIHGSDAAAVLGEWTAHFGAQPTAVQLVTELQGYSEYILSMAQYAAVGAAMRPDHAVSLTSLSVELMKYYQPPVVVTGSRPSVTAPARDNRPTMRELLDSNYRVAHLNPPGDGNTGAMIGLMFLEYGESRRNGASVLGAVSAMGPAMVAATRRRGGGPRGPQPTPRTGPHGVDPNHHNANVMVRDSNGRVVSHDRVVSGNMTVEEQALGFPRNTLASHTEARAVRNTQLRPGDVMTITGQSPPCPSCKGAMNATATETGATIRYRWRQNGRTVTWEARPRGR